uniref:Uncharacterized protein n=1 Tax=Micrurus spixii TaxID=129469 RepID=A0A2D4MDJ4_9SAUR
MNIERKEKEEGRKEYREGGRKGQKTGKNIIPNTVSHSQIKPNHTSPKTYSSFKSMLYFIRLTRPWTKRPMIPSHNARVIGRASVSHPCGLPLCSCVCAREEFRCTATHKPTFNVHTFYLGTLERRPRGERNHFQGRI